MSRLIDKALEGDATAETGKAALELEVSYKSKTKIDSDTIDTPDKIAKVCRSLIGNSAQENFIVLLVNPQMKLIAWSRVSVGTLTEALCHPREVMKPAVLSNAFAFIASHNHPSGQVEPSSQDLSVTRRLMLAGEIMSIPMMDHVIVTDTEYYSFAQNQELPQNLNFDDLVIPPDAEEVPPQNKPQPAPQRSAPSRGKTPPERLDPNAGKDIPNVDTESNEEEGEPYREPTEEEMQNFKKKMTEEFDLMELPSAGFSNTEEFKKYWRKHLKSTAELLKA